MKEMGDFRENAEKLRDAWLQHCTQCCNPLILLRLGIPDTPRAFRGMNA